MTITAPSLSVTVGSVQLSVNDAAFTLDEARVPYGELQLTCAPVTVDELRHLDPRNRPRLTGTFTSLYTQWQNRGDVALPFDLILHSRQIADDTGDLVLVGRTGECQLLDDALLATAAYSPALTSVRTAVAHVLATVGATLQPGDDDDTIDPDASIWLPGVTGWDYLEPILQAAGLRLWCDEQARWWLADADQASNGYAVLSTADQVTQQSDVIDLDQTGWYDGVVVAYDWTDNSGVEHHQYDVAGTNPVRVLTLNYNAKPAKSGAAARVLRRRRAYGNQLQLTAMNDFNLAPSMPCTIEFPDGRPTLYGAITNVSWRMPADEMTLATRDLIAVTPGSWIAAPGGESWDEIPDGISWDDYDPGADYSDAHSWDSIPYGVSWDSIADGIPWTDYNEPSGSWDSISAGISWDSIDDEIPWTDYEGA